MKKGGSCAFAPLPHSRAVPILLGLVWLLVVVSAQAASVLDFPRFSLQPGESTGLAIANPTAGDAEVLVTAYGARGRTLATAEVTVPAGSQVAVLTAELFRSPGFDIDQTAWLQAFSMTNGLTGFFLFFDGAATRLDGAGIPARSRSLSFPQVRVGDGFSTELNVVNVNGAAANVTLTLQGGVGPIVRQIELAPREASRLDVAALFGLPQVAPGSYIQASSNEDLVGIELIATASGEVYAINAKPEFEQLTHLYIPQLVALGAFESRVGVVNRSGQAVELTIIARQADGTPFSGQGVVNPVSRQLAAGEALEEEVADLFGFSGEDGLEGWLEVVSSSPAVSGYFAYELAQTGAAAAVSALVAGSKKALFSQLATAQGFFTGVAGLNPSSLPASYRLVAIDSQGDVLGHYDGVLRPRERFSVLVTDVIPAAAGQSEGAVLARATVPLFLTALFGTTTSSLLANIDPGEIPESFAPDAGIDLPRIDPLFTALQPGGARGFQASGFDGPVEWSVNGVFGGNAELGTVDETGRYTAPSQSPDLLPLTVTATAGESSAAAGVDVVAPDLAAEYPNPVNSLHYLDQTEEIFTSEGGDGLGPQGDRSPAQGLVSTIFGMGSDGERRLLARLTGKEVSDIKGFVARDGRSYLLVSGRNDGRIARLDPANGAARVVVESLNGPEAMVLDPVTGNLLVAEAEQVTSIPRRDLESDLTPAGNEPEPEEGRTSILAPIDGLKGIEVDACTGRVYVSRQTTGEILSYDRGRRDFSPVLGGLSEPGQIGGFYRSGVSCPTAFQLLIVEEGADQVTLFQPSVGAAVSPWIPDIDLDDITLLPEDSPFEGTVAFDQAALSGVGDNLFFVNLPGLYDDRPINPPLIGGLPFRADPPGPDLGASDSAASAGQTASVDVFFRPGDADGEEGGSDEASILAFTLDYDETRLRFDDADTNGDGIPDSVIPNTPAGYELFVAFDPEAPNGELGFALYNPASLAATLPDGPLFRLSFLVLEGTIGTADLVFSPALPPQAADTQGENFSFDEVADGSVSIAP